LLLSFDFSPFEDEDALVPPFYPAGFSSCSFEIFLEGVPSGRLLSRFFFLFFGRTFDRPHFMPRDFQLAAFTLHSLAMSPFGFFLHGDFALVRGGPLALMFFAGSPRPPVCNPRVTPILRHPCFGPPTGDFFPQRPIPLFLFFFFWSFFWCADALPSVLNVQDLLFLVLRLFPPHPPGACRSVTRGPLSSRTLRIFSAFPHAFAIYPARDVSALCGLGGCSRSMFLLPVLSTRCFPF